MKPKSKKPSLEKLKELYENIKNKKTSYVQVWREYWVSDNAIRKWFKTAWFELIKKNKPSVVVTCHYCGKEYKQEYNVLEQNKKNKQHNYCSTFCRDEAQKERGIQGRLSQREFENLYFERKMSIRAIARRFNVAHTQIMKHYKY